MGDNGALWNSSQVRQHDQTVIQGNAMSRGLDRGEPSKPFKILPGVNQGCLWSPFLFFLTTDWVMKQTTQGHSVQWTLMQQLDDLNFATDLALLSHSCQWII